MSSNNHNMGRLGLRIRGVYDPAVSYEVLDVVAYNGSSYVAKIAVPSENNTEPADNEQWMSLVNGDPMFTVTYAASLPETGSEGDIIFVPLS